MKSKWIEKQILMVELCRILHFTHKKNANKYKLNKLCNISSFEKKWKLYRKKNYSEVVQKLKIHFGKAYFLCFVSSEIHIRFCISKKFKSIVYHNFVIILSYVYVWSYQRKKGKKKNMTTKLPVTKILSEYF